MMQEENKEDDHDTKLVHKSEGQTSQTNQICAKQNDNHISKMGDAN